MLDSLGSICGVGDALHGNGGVVLGLLLAGLAGSPIHCAPMCGGFVLGRAADRMALTPVSRLCEWRRLSAGAALPYHLGRLITYAVLGAMAGQTGATLMGLPFFGQLSGTLLLGASALFALQGLRRLWPRRFWVLRGLDRAPAGWQRCIANFTGRMERAGKLNGLLLGATLGFLPCGFLYAALAASAGTSSAVAGALGMAGFGLGTVPVLVGIGLAGHGAVRRWQAGLSAAAPTLLLANSGLLLLLAGRAFLGT